MVSVKMGNKDMVDACKGYMRAAQLDLSTFATVYHKQLAADLYNLRRSVMLGAGSCGPASQYGDFKLFHISVVKVQKRTARVCGPFIK